MQIRSILSGTCCSCPQTASRGFRRARNAIEHHINAQLGSISLMKAVAEKVDVLLISCAPDHGFGPSSVGC